MIATGIDRLEIRKERYLHLLRGEAVKTKVLLIGDRPGPSAPTDPDYHHTPFYSMKHCSGWLNRELDYYEIDESKILWINAENYDGSSFYIDLDLLQGLKYISPLGVKASNFLELKHISTPLDLDYWIQPFHHPQYWKRFKSSETYPLLPYLESITSA